MQCGKPAEGKLDLHILGPTPLCRPCAERYLKAKQRHRGEGQKPGQHKKAGIYDAWEEWVSKRNSNGQLGIGGDKDLYDFANEYGVGERGIGMLRRYLFGSRRQAWTGWGPSVAARQHSVDGWDWDQRLAAYVATDIPKHFMCKCGAKLSVPGYHNCRCGKIWNSYVIGTGGENRQAAVEKFLCREVPVRDNVIVANRRLATLNFGPTAPPKDRPVVLLYGGAFNPVHQGHVDALKNAYQTLADAGYRIDRSVVAPTADKLLAHKLGPRDRLSLQARAAVGRMAFPKDINGSPVDVHTGPGEEVELAEGKPRRTDLANWAQRLYPNHTVINVTGEDASVPGDPGLYPSLYSGAPGSNHDGYFYLTMPRDPMESMSSSKIRAAEAAGQPVPGMTPETESAWRAELAKHRAQFGQPDPRVSFNKRRAWAPDGGRYVILPHWDAEEVVNILLQHANEMKTKTALQVTPELMNMARSGGFTLHDHIGDAPTTGYMVSLDKSTEDSLPISELTPEYVQAFADKHADKLKVPGNYFGGWLNSDGRFYLDISSHTPDLNQATKGAFGNKQLGIYDLTNGKTITTEDAGWRTGYPGIVGRRRNRGTAHIAQERSGGGGQRTAQGGGVTATTRRGKAEDCPACGKHIRSYDLSGVEDHRGQRWCHGCLPKGIKEQMDRERKASRAEDDEEDFASDAFPSDHHPDTGNKLKSTPDDWYRRDNNQRWTG